MVVDRIVVKPGIETRLADSFATALKLADGIAVVETAPAEGEPERTVFSEKFACPVSGFSIPEIEPRLFSFNAPFGACPDCGGLGAELFFDERLIVPDESLSLMQGALAPWAKSKTPYFRQTLEALAEHYGFSHATPWSDLSEDVRQVMLRGSDDEVIKFRFDDGGRVYAVKRPFEGVIPNLQRRYRETDSAWIREEMERFQGSRPCHACDGHRLRAEALAVKIAGDHIGLVTGLSIRDALAWIEAAPGQLSRQKNEIAGAILKEIRERLGFLVNVGLDYLTLSRNSGTLSGGESQRIRLASQIGSGLTGVLYVLDEPSIGLHQRDNRRLLDSLRGLRDQGNTVIVVEHDEEAIREADHVIDIGLGAGVHGGRVDRRRHARGHRPDAGVDHRPVPDRPARDRRAALAPAGQRQVARGRGRERQQPSGRDGGDPARHLRLRHGRLWRRQVDADHRDAVQDRRQQAERGADPAGAVAHHPRARAPRQGDRHRPVADRPDAAVEPGHLYRRLHADPRLVRRPARGQGARLQTRPLQLQRQGRALRGLPGRRRHQDRDALPAGRLRHLRDVQRAPATTARRWR